MTKYIFVEGMREISGFGGGYEEACRKMLVAGLEWLDAHPKAAPKFHGYKGIYGTVHEDNDDAKALSAAVVNAVEGCSGAMHQAVICACLWIRKNGWEKYVTEMSK